MGGNAFLTFIESGAPWWVIIIAGLIGSSFMLVRYVLRRLEKAAQNKDLLDHLLRQRAMGKLSSKELTIEEARVVLGAQKPLEVKPNGDAALNELKNKSQSKQRGRGPGARGRRRGKRGRPK